MAKSLNYANKNFRIKYNTVRLDYSNVITKYVGSNLFPIYLYKLCPPEIAKILIFKEVSRTELSRLDKMKWNEKLLSLLQ